MRHTVLALLALALFVAGFVASSLLRANPPSTTVRIFNATGQPIRVFELVHEHGSASLTEIQDGTTQEITFSVPGESSYKSKATLASGVVLTNDGTYVEAGYLVTETVTATGIANAFEIQAYAP